jgi:hypothetical protein
MYEAQWIVDLHNLAISLKKYLEFELGFKKWVHLHRLIYWGKVQATSDEQNKLANLCFLVKSFVGSLLYTPVGHLVKL